MKKLNQNANSKRANEVNLNRFGIFTKRNHQIKYKI